MSRLDVEGLSRLRDRLRSERAVLEGRTRATVTVHMGPCGLAAGARDVLTALLAALEERGIMDVRVSSSGCAGVCSREPMATVEISGGATVQYADLDAQRIVRILDEHVLGGRAVEEFALARGQ